MTLAENSNLRPLVMKNGANSDWNEERTNLLRKLWDDGFSAKDIAYQLNRDTGSSFTRNAILGKSDRLNLSMRTQSFHNKNYTPDERRQRRRATRRAWYARTRETRPFKTRINYRGIAAVDDQAIPFEQRKTLMQLDNHHCRWPVNDPRHSDFFFCGSPEANLVEGRPYCPGHMGMSIKPLVSGDKLKKVA